MKLFGLIVSRPRRWILWLAGFLLAALAVAAVVVGVAVHRAEPYLRARIVASLEERFHARVELDSFHIKLAGGLWAEGKGLRIWPPAQAAGVSVPAGSGEPLVRLDEFRFHAPLRFKPGAPIHISLVELKGLSVHLPPRSHFEHAAGSDAARPPASASLVRFELDRLECTGATLVLETSKPGKLPLDFAIARLTLTEIAGGGPMGFEAELTNPRPVGAIHTTGHFGPLHGADLGDSAIDGEYRFDHADLGGFKGIAGILNSTGRYQGTLRDLTVDGEADVPDFRLTHFGQVLVLNTKFHAKVDGTNGDTWLDPVDAMLGRSHFTARGAIVRVPGPEIDGVQQSLGHDISLTVDVDKARIEDFLRLASRSGPPLLTADVTLKTTLHIPPGKDPIHERLRLNGSFVLDHALFTSAKIQSRVAELSLRGQGRPDEIKTTAPATILSHIESPFQLAAGLITLPAIAYTVAGARIDLKGTYALEGGEFNFAGNAKLDASVSRLVGGWKGKLLSPADRFFRKQGAGTEVPIQIAGTRQDPQVTVDLGPLKLGTKK